MPHRFCHNPLSRRLNQLAEMLRFVAFGLPGVLLAYSLILDFTLESLSTIAS
jgi:ABC-type Fe3+ transport system permease subunit